MTPEEFFPAIGREANAFVMTDRSANNAKTIFYSGAFDGQKPFYAHGLPFPLNGEAPLLSASFSSVMFREDLRLDSVYLYYPEQTEEKFVKLCRSLEDLADQTAKVCPPKASERENTLKWQMNSASTVMDFSEEDQEKLNGYAHYCWDKLGESPLGGSVADIDYIRTFGARPLSFLSAVYDRHEKSILVTFSGSVMSGELGHLLAYESLPADGRKSVSSKSGHKTG